SHYLTPCPYSARLLPSFFSFLIPLPPTSTLFPYTTLFRSLSLHVPLTKTTRHLIDHRALGLMKPSAVLINVARGPIVEEAATMRSEEHTSELQSLTNLVCRLLLEKKKTAHDTHDLPATNNR